MTDHGREFHLGEDFFLRLRRIYLARSVLMMALLLAVIVVLPALFGPEQTLATTLVMGGFGAAVLVMSGMRGYRRIVARYRGFRIVLFPGGLKHSLPGQEDVYIMASEISRVVSRPGAGCGVEGMTGQQAIWIPATLHGYGDLMQTVEMWRTPEIRTGFWRKSWLQGLLSLALFAAIAVVILAQDRALVSAFGAPLLAYLAWAALALRRSPYLGSNRKGATGAIWFVIALVMAKMGTLWLA